MNITLDDLSPVFQWFADGEGWYIDHEKDTAKSSHFKETYHETPTEGATMRMVVQGITAFYVYGTKGIYYGNYTVTVNSEPPSSLLGYMNHSVYQTILYSRDELDPCTEYTVELMNKPSLTGNIGTENRTKWWLDIDYVVLTAEPEQYSTLIDDTSGLITYAGGGWKRDELPRLELYQNHTVHHTSAQGDSYSVKWNGSSAEIFGTVNQGYSRYAVSLDGENQGTFNASWFQPGFNVSLFSTSGLLDGPHEIVVTNMAQAIIDVDYVVFNGSTKPDLDSVVSNTASSATPEGDDSSPNIGAIAGGAAGGGVALIALGVSIWWLLRRRRKRQTSREGRISPIELARPETSSERPPAPAPSSYAPSHNYEIYELSDSPISTLAPASVMPGPGSTLRSPLSPLITDFTPATLSERPKEAGATEQLLPEVPRQPPSVEREIDVGPLRMVFDDDDDDHEAASLPQSTLPPDYFQATGQVDHRRSDLITLPPGAQQPAPSRTSI